MNQPNLPPQVKRSSAPQPVASRLNVVGTNSTQPQVRHLPQPPSVPVWLRSLLTMQQGAMVLFASMLGLSAIVYSYTAYTQSMWRSQHGKLERLQLQESQQGVMNEHLKQQMAKDADRSNSGLVAPSPDRLVFIPSAPQRPTKSLPAPHSTQLTRQSKLPLGY